LKGVSRRAETKLEKRLRLQAYASAEAEWFYGTLGGQVPTDASAETVTAARSIEARLKELPAFHRGAFSLRWTPRTWPEPLDEKFDDQCSVVVRLECTQHPAVGKSLAELEAASIERLTALIGEAEKEKARRKGRGALPGIHEAQLARLAWRAYQHVESAVSALAKVRGDVACLVPGWVDQEEDHEGCE